MLARIRFASAEIARQISDVHARQANALTRAAIFLALSGLTATTRLDTVTAWPAVVSIILALISTGFAVSALWLWRSSATVWDSEYVLGLGLRPQLGIERRHMNDLMIELTAARTDLKRKNGRVRLALLFVILSWTWEVVATTIRAIVQVIGGSG